MVPRTFANPSEDLQSRVNRFLPLLEQDQSEQRADNADLLLEDGDAFFPASGTGSSSRASDPRAASPVVLFRLNGTEYALHDVPSSAWFAPYVRDAADRGIVSGYRDAAGVPTGEFGPERSVSVEELAKMALLAAALDTSGCPAVPRNAGAKTSWSAPFIACAEQLALAIYTDGTVDITRPATRAEVVMTVLQAFGVSLRESPPPGLPLKDVTASTLFSSAIFTAVDDGVVAGDSDASGRPTGVFGPERPVNRAEVAKIVSLAVQVYGTR